MYVQEAKVGQTIKDKEDGHTITIKRSINTNTIEVVIIKPPKHTEHITESVVGGTYAIGFGYGGDGWELVNKVPEVKKPVTKLDMLKKELQQAKTNVEKIEASITKHHESLALKPGVMYKSDDHFNGQVAIFMCENSGDHEFYLGGEFRNIEVAPDDLEKFQPLTLPNQRKMAKAVVAFIEGRIPTN